MGDESHVLFLTGIQNVLWDDLIERCLVFIETEETQTHETDF